MNNVYLNENELSLTRDKLKKELSNMDNTLNEIIANLREVSFYYRGDTYSQAFEKLGVHVRKYATYKSTIENYIKFLDEVIEKYKYNDNTLIDKVE